MLTIQLPPRYTGDAEPGTAETHSMFNTIYYPRVYTDATRLALTRFDHTTESWPTGF